MTVNDALRKEVVAAFEAGDELAVRRLGWQDVWEFADYAWRPRQSCSMKQFVWYAKLLGAEDPANVLEAFTELCGEYRPTPAHVRGHLHRPKDAAEPKRNGPTQNPFLKAEAVAAVADALKAGEPECECQGFHPSRFQFDPAGVLRCRDCHGLEPGQVYAAEDAEPPTIREEHR
jgi:hypothetical protein